MNRRWTSGVTGLAMMASLALVGGFLAGCSGGGSSGVTGTNATPKGSIAIQVSGTTVVAVGPPPGDQILATDSSAGKPGPPYTLTLSGLPLNQPIRLFVIENGTVYPVVFSGTTNNAFLLSNTTQFNMGQVFPLITPNGPQATVANVPSTVTASGSLLNIPQSIQNPVPDPSLTQAELLATGEGLFKSGAFHQAQAFFAGAISKGGAQTDLAHFYSAHSRVVGVLTNLYSGSNLGNILTTSGCNADDVFRSSWDVTLCPLHPVYPAGQIQNFTFTDVNTELQAALADLNSISQNFGSASNVFGYAPDGTRAEFDYGDVLFLKGIANGALGMVQLQQAVVTPATIDTNTNPTYQLTLAAYPAFPQVGPSATLGAGRTNISNGLDNLKDAVNYIFAETDPQADDYINLIGERQSDLLANIVAYKVSLAGPGTNTDGVTFNFNALFTSSSPFTVGASLQSYLPPFSGNKVSGLFPDPSLGGLIVSGANINKDSNMNGIPDLIERLN